ncbi:hypothetical protein [Spirosoma sp.]|uniref:hypothetical protein n=1 Tax=Spirosoma sp. TaxID=1899569 RepID=UPI00260785A4|nr:hypothetical protein [Spirosoma sp.]MCX6216518.1 hypothetical protein [Spirosoma sp.]
MNAEEKAEQILNRITSYAPWSDWNGVPRVWIKQKIVEGLQEFAATSDQEPDESFPGIYPPGPRVRF